MKKLENNDAMLDRITLIATLYYKDKLSQQEIAKKLNISRLGCQNFLPVLKNSVSLRLKSSLQSLEILS